MRIEEDLKLDFQDVLIRPKRSTLGSRAEVDISRDFVFRHSGRSYSGVPIIAANMDTVGTFEMAQALARHGMATALHKHYADDELATFFAAPPAGGTVFYSMGITTEDYDKFRRVEARCGDAITTVCVDVANGYTKAFVDFLHKLRAAYPKITIMAGNVVTGEMAEELILDGAPGLALERERSVGDPEADEHRGAVSGLALGEHPLDAGAAAGGERSHRHPEHPRPDLDRSSEVAARERRRLLGSQRRRQLDVAKRVDPRGDDAPVRTQRLSAGEPRGDAGRVVLDPGDGAGGPQARPARLDHPLGERRRAPDQGVLPRGADAVGPAVAVGAAIEKLRRGHPMHVA